MSNPRCIQSLEESPRSDPSVYEICPKTSQKHAYETSRKWQFQIGHTAAYAGGLHMAMADTAKLCPNFVIQIGKCMK